MLNRVNTVLTFSKQSLRPVIWFRFTDGDLKVNRSSASPNLDHSVSLNPYSDWEGERRGERGEGRGGGRAGREKVSPPTSNLKVC